MHLINCLIRAAVDHKRDGIITSLDELEVRKVLMRLMLSSPPEELGKQLVEFQRLLVQENHRCKRVPVLSGVDHDRMLREIWEASGVEAREGARWRLVGFNVRY